MSQWLPERLCEIVEEMKLADATVLRLRDVLDSDFAMIPDKDRQAGLEVVFAGYSYELAEQSVGQPAEWIVRFYCKVLKRNSHSSNFRAIDMNKGVNVQEGYVVALGQSQAIAETSLVELERAARDGEPDETLVSKAVDVIREVNETSPALEEVVGDDIVSLILPSNLSATPVVRFHSAAPTDTHYFSFVVQASPPLCVTDMIVEGTGAPPSVAIPIGLPNMS
jgi:hypothetical protein